MSKKNIDDLKKTLIELGFDSSKNEELERKIKEGFPKFILTYEDEQKEPGLSYHIHFSKNARGSAYQITHFTTFLERELSLSNAFINGINTQALGTNLSYFDWPAFHGGRENHEAVESLRNDLTILSQTEQGRNIAQLLIAKYWPDTMPVAERDEYLSYDAVTNTFSLRKDAPADGSWSAHQVYDVLKSAMDGLSMLKNIHNYTLIIEAEQVNTHTNVTGRSKIVFESLSQAFANLEAIDYRLFDKKFIDKNKLPCQFKKINLIDTFDNVVVVAKIIEFQINPSEEKNPVTISYDINEKKIRALDFVKEVRLDATKSINTQSLDDIKNLLNIHHLTVQRSNIKIAPKVKVAPALKKSRRYPRH